MLDGYCGYEYVVFFFFQAEDGIRDLVRSRGLGDVYKRQPQGQRDFLVDGVQVEDRPLALVQGQPFGGGWHELCLLYTSDAADERSSVDLGGRRIIKKKKKYDGGWRHIG